MNPTRILPDLQASLLCEDVRQEITGNFILVGILGVVRVPQLPIKAFKLCVFNRWTAGLGQFTETVRLLAPDSTTVMRQSNVKFALQDPTHHAINVTLYTGIEFSAPGAYYIEVLVDDVMKLRYPVPILLQPPPGPPPASAPPPPAG